MSQQLTKEEIDVIIEGIKATQPIRTLKNASWVIDDGAYEDISTHSRVFVYDRFVYIVASQMWIENPVENMRLPEWLRAPWGSYPPFPPKPPKPAK